ncbi:MAG TPA: hypothetical protein VHO69_02140 [Phototrophicaceae bacterium]|nr:hypothetical protein [Phototrophicaceae bacterium]
MSEEDRSQLHQVQEYRKIVLLYEALDEQIDAFLTAHGGHTEKMSADEVAQYRQMARRRDDLLNQMRAMEHQLNINEDE